MMHNMMVTSLQEKQNSVWQLFGYIGTGVFVLLVIAMIIYANCSRRVGDEERNAVATTDAESGPDSLSPTGSIYQDLGNNPNPHGLSI